MKLPVPSGLMVARVSGSLAASLPVKSMMVEVKRMALPSFVPSSGVCASSREQPANRRRHANPIVETNAGMFDFLFFIFIFFYYFYSNGFSFSPPSPLSPVSSSSTSDRQSSSPDRR
uniref:hypothetical protein n=1 Tax=Butyricimonas faecalis TaxID=2093856 RepID=UPI003FF06A27